MRGDSKRLRCSYRGPTRTFWNCVGFGITTSLLSSSCAWPGHSPGDRLASVKVAVNQSPKHSAPLLESDSALDEVIKAAEAEEGVFEDELSIEWSKSHGYQCYTSEQYKGFCQGPRRVPKPHGPDAALAAELGLGERRTASQLMVEGPDPLWVEAAGPDTEPDELMWPIPDGSFLRGYGAPGLRNKSHVHKGIDIGADKGAIFYAASKGLVAYSDNGVSGYGNLLIVVHPNKSVAFYSHARALYLFAGQRVARGQALGEVGETGFAQCPHLHFEYRIKGRPINPVRKFGKRQGHLTSRIYSVIRSRSE